MKKLLKINKLIILKIIYMDEKVKTFSSWVRFTNFADGGG